jgi:serine/threonine-protein kinase RsbT
MPTVKDETHAILADRDIVDVRRTVREWAVSLGFSLVEQTKIITAASELARNVVRYGGGGQIRLEALTEPGRRGLRLTFIDDGPGIPDVEQALRDGFTTGGGLGLGLGGAKRLVDCFEIDTKPGVGTRVMITRWT